jgi:uncharacterized flavoprotein (TIGR03862 family)
MTSTAISSTQTVAIIGGGPAGLMAAELLSQAGFKVDLFDAMPSVGRKFLLAGVGGMNITHSEPSPAFVSRYAERATVIAPLLRGFGAQALCEWIHGLGIQTFVGSSGRVFPADMKAAPLLRAWLKRLRESGVFIHTRHRWLGWNADNSLRIDGPDGEVALNPDATLLALGGASWSRLGSDGAWVPLLEQRGVNVAPLQAANCGFEVSAWSELLRSKFAGAPLKNIAMGVEGQTLRLGECVVTQSGVEGSLVYALSSQIREAINQSGSATVEIDLLPGKSVAEVQKALSKPRGSRSMSKHLHSQLGLDGVKAALLRELTPAAAFADPALLALAIKALPLTLIKPRPLDEAISTAGGVTFEALNEHLMIPSLPSAPARCSTGKRPPAAICSPPASPAAAPQGWGWWTGCAASKARRNAWTLRLHGQSAASGHC